MDVSKRKFLSIILGGIGCVSVARFAYVNNWIGGEKGSSQLYVVEFSNQWIYDVHFKDVFEFEVVKYPNSDDFLLINGIIVSSEDVTIRTAN